MYNYLDVASKKIEEISEIIFLSERNENLKKFIISSLLNGDKFENIRTKINSDYKSLIDDIKENSSIQMILKAKNHEAILDLLSELLMELKDLNNQKK